MRVYLCTLFKISECAYTIGKNLQLFYCYNIKYALTSSVVLEIFLFRLMQQFLPNWPFVLLISSFSFLTSLSTKELKLQCPSLNKHYQKKNEFKRMNCISYVFRWIIILRVFVESFILSRDLRFSFFNRLFFFLL
jgi:hypothetical protein